MLIRRQGGFTLVEVMVAIVMLTVAVLGLAASASRMLTPTTGAETEYVALQYVEDRLAEVRLDPRYGVLDSLYAATETPLDGLPGSSRVTSFARTRTAQASGKFVDFWTIMVTVQGGRLEEAISRTLIVAAP